MVISSRRRSSIGTVSGEWECDECGYTRRGTLRNRPKRCPVCRTSGDSFTFWSDEEEDWDEDEDDWDDEEYSADWMDEYEDDFELTV